MSSPKESRTLCVVIALSHGWRALVDEKATIAWSKEILTEVWLTFVQTMCSILINEEHLRRELLLLPVQRCKTWKDKCGKIPQGA